MQQVNLVISCTNRKKATAPEELRVRSLTAGSTSTRLSQWIGRLTQSPTAARPATALYAGDHWHVANTIPDAAREAGLAVRLLVCSAGYGLLDSTADIKPYSATFTARQSDSVLPEGGEALSEWWRGLCGWDYASGGPRSYLQLAQADPSTPLIVVASPPYLSATDQDLHAAAQALASPALLSIMSVGANTRRWSALGPHLLPADARFEAVVGGTRAALNARLTRRVLERLPRHQIPSTDVLSSVLSEMAHHLPPLRTHDRTTLSDEEVLRFISDRRREEPLISKSRLLRQLRVSGAACEQKRFSKLFYLSLEASANGR